MTQPKIDPIRAAHLALGGATDDAAAADDLRRALDRRYPQPRPAERIIESLLNVTNLRHQQLMGERVNVTKREAKEIDCQEITIDAQDAHALSRTTLRTASYSAGKLLHIQLIRAGQAPNGLYRRVMGESYLAPNEDNPLDDWWTGITKLATSVRERVLASRVSEDREEADTALYDFGKILRALDLRRPENGGTITLAREMWRFVQPATADTHIHFNPLNPLTSSPRWNHDVVDEGALSPEGIIQALNHIAQDMLKDKP